MSPIASPSNAAPPPPLPAKLAPRVNIGRVADLIGQLLVELGEDPTREGLAGTPGRVAAWWSAFLSADGSATVTCFAESPLNDQLVVVGGMSVWSLCIGKSGYQDFAECLPAGQLCGVLSSWCPRRPRPADSGADVNAEELAQDDSGQLGRPVPEGRIPGRAWADAESMESVHQLLSAERCPGRAAGKQPLPVSVSSVRGCWTGSSRSRRNSSSRGGGRTRGSRPRTRVTASPLLTISFGVIRTTRVSGWANSRTSRPATRSAMSITSSCSSRRINSHRASWSMKLVPVRGITAGISTAAECRFLLAQSKKLRAKARLDRLPSSQRSISPWLQVARVRPCPLSQARRSMAALTSRRT